MLCCFYLSAHNLHIVLVSLGYFEVLVVDQSSMPRIMNMATMIIHILDHRIVVIEGEVQVKLDNINQQLTVLIVDDEAEIRGKRPCT